MKSHIFTSWDIIPDISHLLKIENNYVYVFDHKIPGSISYVAYIVEDNKVVAFGSATYFAKEHDYMDDFDDYNEKISDEEQEEWRLWVEGLVSIKKGCGTLVLRALETWLTKMAYEVKNKVINIMSVDESIGFYEENGYVECMTGPRFAGTGNTRVAKKINNGDIQSAKIVNNILHEEFIASCIVLGRRKILNNIIDIPKEIKRCDYAEYVKNNLIHDKKETICKWIDEYS